VTSDPAHRSLPDVSVVVPCFNEGEAIGDVLERIVAYLDHERSTLRSEIVAVNDGSSDSTGEALHHVSARNPDTVRVITHAANAGLTQAMKTGAEHASMSTVLFLDADLSYAPNTIRDLIDAKTRTSAAVSIASPYMAGGRVGNVPLIRLIASRGANWLLSFTVERRIRTFTGMVRAYDRDVFLRLAADVGDGEFNAAMVAAALRAGLRIIEVPAGLIWPLARTAAAPRLSYATLWKRAKLVLATIAELRGSGKGFVKFSKTGTLVPVQRPLGPCSPGSG
jgi:glycosyltransferase involved in cell wall biosynthesis